jgi:hypothetical protein
MRQELAESWQPRNGVERQLLEIMVQAQTAAEHWLKRLMAKAALEAAMELATLRKNGQWEPPRATAFQAVEQAVSMAERFNRVFLRTLRALQDLRRHTPAVVVQNVGGQVNVGAQQVNVAQQPGGRNRAERPRGDGRRPRGSPRPCTCPADRDISIGKNGCVP